MSKASDIVEQYNKKFKTEPTVVEEVKPKLSNEDLKAKAIVESLVDNNFSVDVPTRKDAISELAKLAESRSPVAKRMMELLDDVMSATYIDEDGNFTVKTSKIKLEY